MEEWRKGFALGYERGISFAVVQMKRVLSGDSCLGMEGMILLLEEIAEDNKND